MAAVSNSQSLPVCDWPISDFSRWLRSERRRRGLSQTERARRAGVSRAYVSRLERANATAVAQPRAAVVRQFAAALDADALLVLVEAGYRPSGAAARFHPYEVRDALLRDPAIGPDVAGVVYQLYLLLRKRATRRR